LIEAAKRGFDLGIRCELAALCLSETFENIGEVSGVNRLGLPCIASEA
jgi:hypothetical protein